MLTSVLLIVLLLTSPLTIGVLVLWAAHRDYIQGRPGEQPER
jgi:hypothetical protein